jgi:hypothetical protein
LIEMLDGMIEIDGFLGFCGVRIFTTLHPDISYR